MHISVAGFPFFPEDKTQWAVRQCKLIDIKSTSALARGAYDEYGAWRAVCVTCVCVCVCVGVVPWVPCWHPSGALICEFM